MYANPAIVAALRRSQQLFVAQLAAPERLSWGVSYASKHHPLDPHSHVVIDAIDVDGSDIDAHLASSVHGCCTVLPAIEGGAAKEPFVARGFVEARYACHGRLGGAPATPRASLSIVGARAAPRAVSRLIAERFADNAIETAYRERLDDAAFDGFVALDGVEPLGMIVLHQAGAIGRVRDLFVAASHRRSGVGRALLAHALSAAWRWSLTPIVAAAGAEDAAADALLRATGFEVGGMISAFRRRGTPESVEW